MKRIYLALLALTVGLVIGALPAAAHHGNAAYDMEKVVPLKATITGFEFGNPHVQIFFDTKDDNGKVVHWNCEGTNPAMLQRIGWTRNTLKPGDQVTLYVHPNKDPQITVGLLVKAVLANGQVLESKNPV
ncbi:MAG TPA: DUF6152 family protein [Candidatus Acidoferrales bacterium]|nr:DUF6152 family protein [Candidatus Acidoferrales bacterium]